MSTQHSSLVPLGQGQLSWEMPDSIANSVEQLHIWRLSEICQNPTFLQVPTLLPLTADKLHIVSRDRVIRLFFVPHNVVLTLASILEVAAPFC